MEAVKHVHAGGMIGGYAVCGQRGGQLVDEPEQADKPVPWTSLFFALQHHVPLRFRGKLRYITMIAKTSRYDQLCVTFTDGSVETITLE